MVATVAEAAVTMMVDILRRQQPFKSCLQIRFRARARLDERNSRGRMRNEHVHQAVPSLATKRFSLRREIRDEAAA